MKKQLLTIVAALALTTSAYAGTYGVGITGSLFNVDTDATETTTAGTVAGGSANTNSKTIENNGLMSASFYAEYTFDGFYGATVGVDYTPGSADLKNQDLSRIETPASGENEGTSTTYKANGEVENLITYYAEIPVGGFYVRGGFTQVDVNTKESGVAAYGNDTVNGINYGIGIKSGTDSGVSYKFALEHTDFDTVSIKSSSGNTVKGDIDVTGLKVSVGYNF